MLAAVTTLKWRLLGRFPDGIHNRTVKAAEFFIALRPRFLCQPRRNPLGTITGADRHLVARGLSILPAHLQRAVIEDRD